ncbi:MAG: hypothetical protein GQ524_09650, partial [Anaerolineales bacterium]|nr:hypothetical protein [Anaerolineales bacterium]
DLPPHLAVFWDDIDLMRGRAQDFFRYEIMGADSIKEYFTKTGAKWGYYWQVQEQIYNASAQMADDLVEAVATGEARFMKRRSVKEFMDLIGFPLELDETGRLVAIIDQNNVFRNTPIKLQDSLNNFESLMYKNAPHKYPWDAPFPGRSLPPSGTDVPVWKPTDPKVGPGGGALPEPSVGPQGPTADVKPLDDAGRGWTMGEVGPDDIKLTPEFQPRDTAGNELQVDADRVRVMGNNWDWKKYEAIKVNVVQPGEASLYGKGIEDGDIVLMGGHHRYAAGLEAGVDDFPSQIYQVQFEEAKQIATLDNMIRQDQTPYEKGRIFKSRMESGATETELATVIFNDPNKASYVAKLVSLTELSPDVARMVGHYSWFNEKHGFALADAVRKFDINPEFQQQIVTKYLAEYAPSVEQFRQFLAHYGPRNKRAVQMGLFAMDESWLSAFASTQDEIKLLEGRARKVKGVINDPDLAKELGIDVDEAQKIIDDLRAKKAELTEMSGIDPGTPRTPQQVEKAEKIAGVEKKVEAFIDDVDEKAAAVASKVEEVEELVEEGFNDPLLERLKVAGREEAWYGYKNGDYALEDLEEILAVQERYTAKTYGVDPLLVIEDLKIGDDLASRSYGKSHYPGELHSDVIKWLKKNDPDLREAIKLEAIAQEGSKPTRKAMDLRIEALQKWEQAHSVAKSAAYLENMIPLEVRLAWARDQIAKMRWKEALRSGSVEATDLGKFSKKAGLDFHSAAKEWGIEPQKVRDLLAGQDPVDILKVAYDEAEEVADAAIKKSRKIEGAAEEAKAAIEPSTGDIGTSADAAPSVDLSERVGKAGPDTVVRREAERLVPSESRVTHAGGGDAAGTKS